jgi:hypothetical protein
MYKIIFEDGTEFLGGEPDNSKWNEIPIAKNIAELHYDLCGKQIILKGYEAYNHIVKHAFLIDSQQQAIVAVIIIVLELGIVKRFIFDLIKNELITDNILYGQEYNNKPTSGWKVGLKNIKSEFKIN